VWLSDGGRFLYLHGNFAPVNAADVTVVDPPPPPFAGDLADPTDPVPSPYPFPDFYTAIQCTRDLIERAGGEWLSLHDAASAWFEHPECDAVLQSLTDLLELGMAEQCGNGNARQVRVTELGWRCFDSDLDASRRALAEAALKSQLIADYAGRWLGGRPEDDICIAEFMRERGFTEKAAARFVRVLDQALIFIRPTRESSTGASPEPPPDRLSERPLPAEVLSSRERNRLHLCRRGDRIELRASVDLAGLAELQEILARYERDWRVGSREQRAGS
jgi:hypothetical protein